MLHWYGDIPFMIHIPEVDNSELRGFGIFGTDFSIQPPNGPFSALNGPDYNYFCSDLFSALEV